MAAMLTTSCCAVCQRCDGEPADGQFATGSGCKGACVHWALHHASEVIVMCDCDPMIVVEHARYIPKINTILDDLVDVGLSVCWQSRMLPDILGALLIYNDADEYFRINQCYNNYVAQLLVRIHSLSYKIFGTLLPNLAYCHIFGTPDLPRFASYDMVLSLHAFIDKEAPPTQALVIKCALSSGATFATLQMDPHHATVADVVHEVGGMGLERLQWHGSRIAWDWNAYNLSDFVEYYGEDVGKQVWRKCEVRVAANGRPYCHKEFGHLYGFEEGERRWDVAPHVGITIQLVSPDGILLTKNKRLLGEVLDA